MTENMEYMQEAKRLIGKMVEYVRLYEQGSIGNPDVFETALVESQITALKQSFNAARTACKAELDKVTG